ncbi:oxygenase MpaB family protein [Cryobacterium sp. SO2]|uniref:oxygenase MpaB family protein n=1 Tax=Cryobacterium sp. SO2 TaxID=1897060 RepID=UPI00223CA923|nr:oxygenase MpaB family protein [Cryobacterium sp. SO2]WEO75756.1 oxygenase MpaB family protein [Cryobacterium sp. SO2]
MRQTPPAPAVTDRPALGIRDIAPESVLVLAGGRAILLQLANPAVGHGVARHSDFAARPLGRLSGTLAYVYAVTCGTPLDRAVAVRRVALAHRPVHSAGEQPAGAHSVDSPSAGTPAYNAFDPQLQLWVAATLYESATRMHDLVYGPLGDDDAESVYRDYGVLGTALQVPPGLWPEDRRAFAAYWRRATAELSTDATTRGVADRLLHPRAGPVWLRLAMPLARLMTTGLLKPEERALFALPWSAGRQRRYDALVGTVRLIYPRLPSRLRHAPMRHYLRAGRKLTG